MNMNNSLNTFFALLQRDMLLLKRNIKGKIIDGLFMCIVVISATGFFLPALGMKQEMIGPMFINIFFNIFFMFGFSMSINFANEIKNKGRIFYLFTLPTNRFSIVASYIVSFMIEATIIVLPLLAIGLFVLHDRILFFAPNPLLFILMHIASLSFFGVFMLFIAMHYNYNWFLDNIWARRLTPMFNFGATFFLWKQAYAMAPLLAFITLLNPLVYICEGLRAGFIGGDTFINGWYCLGTLILFTITFGILLNKSIKKRLDPVC